MKPLQALRDDLAACLAEIDGLSTLSVERELSDEESAKFDALVQKSKDLTAACDQAEAHEKAVADAREKLAYLNKPVRKANPGPAVNMPQPSAHFAPAEQPRIEFPVSAAQTPYLSKLTHYTAEQRTRFAFNFGRWAMAMRGHQSSQRYCIENGISMEATAQTEGSNFNGGYLVPEQFDNTMIDLKLQYGVFRQYAENVNMTSETLTRPRRTAGLTAYFVNEDSAITESNMTWDRVNLVAKDLYVISRMTNQLSDDAVISIGDALAGEMAYAFANKEDGCGFNGDGTSTYGGIVGLKVKVTASTSGLITGASGTHTNWAGITLANFNSMVGLLPSFGRTPNTRWFCSPAFYGSVIQRVEYAAGGNSIANLAAGGPATFLGYPVVQSEILVASAAAAEVVCYLGDLSAAAMFGNRRGTSIAFSDSAVINSVSMFERNEVAIRAWERFDITVHSPSSTAAGAVVGLLTAS